MLPRLEPPPTLVVGDRTPLGATEQAAIEAGIPLIRIADAGHNMMLDDPVEFAAALEWALG